MDLWTLWTLIHQKILTVVLQQHPQGPAPSGSAAAPVPLGGYAAVRHGLQALESHAAAGFSPASSSSSSKGCCSKAWSIRRPECHKKNSTAGPDAVVFGGGAAQLRGMVYRPLEQQLPDWTASPEAVAPTHQSSLRSAPAADSAAAPVNSYRHCSECTHRRYCLHYRVGCSVCCCPPSHAAQQPSLITLSCTPG